MAWYSWVLKEIGSVVISFLAQVMIDLITNKDARKLARQAVEKVLELDLNNDGEIIDKSTEKFLEQAKEIGLEVSRNEARNLVNEVLLKLKEEGLAQLTEDDEK